MVQHTHMSFRNSPWCSKKQMTYFTIHVYSLLFTRSTCWQHPLMAQVRHCVCGVQLTLWRWRWLMCLNIFYQTVDHCLTEAFCLYRWARFSNHIDWYSRIQMLQRPDSCRSAWSIFLRVYVVFVLLCMKVNTWCGVDKNWVNNCVRPLL